MIIKVEVLVSPIGPAGDAVYVPMRISGGRIIGVDVERPVIGGSDFATMHADEAFEHNGRLVVGDPAGDIIVRYFGVSQAAEGAYDELLDGTLPRETPCRLNVQIWSTSPQWRPLNRKPLLGVGTFGGSSGTLDVIVLSVVGRDPRN
jgi:hypothetical protein